MSVGTRAAPTGAATVTYREALREAMREALRRDTRVFLMGEDVGLTAARSRSAWDAGGVRAGAYPRHSAVGVGLRRCGHRCRARRDAARSSRS